MNPNKDMKLETIHIYMTKNVNKEMIDLVGNEMQQMEELIRGIYMLLK